MGQKEISKKTLVSLNEIKKSIGTIIVFFLQSPGPWWHGGHLGMWGRGRSRRFKVTSFSHRATGGLRCLGTLQGTRSSCRAEGCLSSERETTRKRYR